LDGRQRRRAIVDDAQARVAPDAATIGIQRDVEIGRRAFGGGTPAGRRRVFGRRRADPRPDRGGQRERDRRPKRRQGPGSGPRPGAAIAVDAAASLTPKSSL